MVLNSSYAAGGYSAVQTIRRPVIVRSLPDCSRSFRDQSPPLSGWNSEEWELIAPFIVHRHEDHAATKALPSELLDTSIRREQGMEIVRLVRSVKSRKVPKSSSPFLRKQDEWSPPYRTIQCIGIALARLCQTYEYLCFSTSRLTHSAIRDALLHLPFLLAQPRELK